MDLIAVGRSLDRPSPSASASSSSSQTAPSYSETNNQVQGVDEADIVKTDGTYIYTLTPGAAYHFSVAATNEQIWLTCNLLTCNLQRVACGL